MSDALKNFFINYNSTDRLWSEWIAWQLESEGYSTVLQAQDFWSESEFVQEMEKGIVSAECAIIVLSPKYLEVLSAYPELATALRPDLAGMQNIFLPVHVRECRDKLKELFALIPSIDLIGLGESEAREKLLASVHRERAKLLAPPEFPEEISRSVTNQPRFPRDLPSIPYQPNPFFTGREEILRHLHKAFRSEKMKAALPQPQAVTGLGGIGKTQIAVEYAYRYHNDYRFIFWAKADSRQSLVLDLRNIATLLNLSGKDEQNEDQIIAAVKHWLKDHTDWLLIIDNANDLSLAREFIPLAYRGYILLTTQAQALGRVAQSIKIDKMPTQEGGLLLLRRANIIPRNATLEETPASERAKAEEISKIMGGLPLALDQAGAYIEETDCGLAGYLELYQTRHRATLLKRRGGLVSSYPDRPHTAYHPEPVATTWTPSFTFIQQANSAAAELLQICAFLNPDAIPEEIITDTIPHFVPIHKLKNVAADPFELDAAIEALRRYSFISRNPNDKTLSRYLPHAQDCVDHIKQWNIKFPEAIRLLSLLNQAATYLWQRAQYVQAESLYQQVQATREQVLGPEHPDVAAGLHDLALLYRSRGRYDQAEALFKRSLDIRERTYGPEHPDVAFGLHELAWLYRAQGRYTEAEPLFNRALEIRAKTLDSEHSDVANTQNELAWLYRVLGRYTEAEPLFNRALEIRVKLMGPDHPDVAQTLNDLAWLFYDQGKYAQAITNHLQALRIREEAFGREHPDVAQSLNNLAWLFQIDSKYAEAEKLYKRALDIRTRILGPEHPYVAQTLDNLASLYYHQGKYSKAERHYNRALRIREQALGLEHPDIAQTYNNLALLYCVQGKYDQAEPLFKRSLAVRERAFGLEHPFVANCLDNLAELYRMQDKYDQAEVLFQRSLEIRQRVLGLEHPLVAQTLNNLGKLYYDQDKYKEAEKLYQQALDIRRRTLGAKHPLVAQTLNNLGKLYYDQDKYKEAEKLYQQALDIRRWTLGEEHPYVAETLNDIGRLYCDERMYKEAEELYQRALAIREKTLGPNHPELATVLQNYAILLRRTGRETQGAEMEERAKAILAWQARESSTLIEA